MRAVDEKREIMTCCGLMVIQLHLLMFVLGFKIYIIIKCTMCQGTLGHQCPMQYCDKMSNEYNKMDQCLEVLIQPHIHIYTQCKLQYIPMQYILI